MYSQHESNPHFLPQPPYPQHDTHRPRFPPQPRPSRHDQPQPVTPPKTRPHGKHGGEMPPPHEPEQQQGQGQQRPSPLPVPVSTTGKTRPVAWIIAAFCTLFWITVIVAGLAVLIIYLVYRPRLPKFDISTATLNAAYLDMGYLLNADLTILANFTNPNKKVSVDFSYAIMDLYYESNLLATRYVEPFTAHRAQSIFEDIHMVTSQVRLPIAQSQDLTRQMSSGRVNFVVKGLFRARSNLGRVLRYSYWLYTHCTITVTGPPSGALISKKCTTKR
ncbi:uncharacterized protein At1g08160-like [Coffea eugenioides]|uniref:uncharacterized protein At1g08160-like n=1 Tax=Coffea eugenioides TaxID=49369 RepID=UPI000F604BB7|nr:uncharacterized protein At1g08160-like [Coffea eugenioides]